MTRTKIASHSYTTLNCFQICPHQYFHRYVVRDIPFQETEAMKWGTSVHKAFENRLSFEQPFPPNMQKYERFALAVEGAPLRIELSTGMTEQGMLTDFWNGAFIRGKIDCARLNDFSEPTKAYLFDWKTGKPYEKPLELKIGAMLLKAHYPSLKIIYGSFVWLRDERIGVPHNLGDVELTMRECKSIISRIEHCEKTDQWHKVQGPLCKWCDVLDCEYNCKE